MLAVAPHILPTTLQTRQPCMAHQCLRRSVSRTPVGNWRAAPGELQVPRLHSGRIAMCTPAGPTNTTARILKVPTKHAVRSNCMFEIKTAHCTVHMPSKAASSRTPASLRRSRSVLGWHHCKGNPTLHRHCTLSVHIQEHRTETTPPLHSAMCLIACTFCGTTNQLLVRPWASALEGFWCSP